MSHEPMDIPCMTKGCNGRYAEPVFTAAMSTIKRDEPKTRQPKWYCKDCRPKHWRVSPTTGRRVVASHGLHRERLTVARKGVTVSGEKTT